MSTGGPIGPRRLFNHLDDLHRNPGRHHRVEGMAPGLFAVADCIFCVHIVSAELARLHSLFFVGRTTFGHPRRCGEWRTTARPSLRPKGIDGNPLSTSSSSIPRRLQWTYLISSSSSSFSVASDECCPLYICFPSMTNQPDGILLFASLWKIKRPRDALTSSESGHLLFPHKHLLLLLQVRGGRDDRPAAYSRLS